MTNQCGLMRNKVQTSKLKSITTTLLAYCYTLQSEMIHFIFPFNSFQSSISQTNHQSDLEKNWEKPCVFLDSENDWLRQILISWRFHFRATVFKKAYPMLMIRINRRALITSCRMKRKQQNCIMTTFQRPGIRVLDLRRGVWSIYCFSFSTRRCTGETAANCKTQQSPLLPSTEAFNWGQTRIMRSDTSDVTVEAVFLDKSSASKLQTEF